jgi:GNAT superfamily N-acetyltransferase
MGELRIRPMKSNEISLAIDWAAAEGWNPGLDDAACFATVDPNGFLIGEIDGVPAATISCVNYDDRFSFLGFYIVRPDLRGRGYGLRIWQAAIAHAGSRVIGLDGVVAQQRNYEKSGFVRAYPNVRYGGTVSGSPLSQADVVPLTDIALPLIEASDASMFPAPRTTFLRRWIGAPGHVGRALLRNGKLAAWGVIRPCRVGHKVGPLVADDRSAAETVLAALLASAQGGAIFLDVPSVNPGAMDMAQALGLSPVFETCRMYTGAIPPLRLDHAFGVTSFELG